MHNSIIKREHQLMYDIQSKSHCFPIFEPENMDKIRCGSAGDFKRFVSDSSGYKDNNSDGQSIDNEEYIKCLEKEAYQKGYDEGNTEGIAKGKKLIEPLMKKLQQTMVDIEHTKKKLYTAAEKEAVELSLAIAKKIIGNELSINKNVVAKTVKEALKKVDGHGKIKIKINPEELDIVKEQIIDKHDAGNSMDKLIFEPNDSISFGGCLIETNIGDIDARIEKQIEVIEKIFKSE